MALREINLLPDDILFRLQLTRHLVFWAGSLIITLSSIFGFHIYQTHVALARNGIFTPPKETERRIAASIEEIKRIQGKIKRLDQQQSVIGKIVRNSTRYRVLSRLINIMDNSTSLTELTLDALEGAEKGAKLMVSGFSAQNEDLGNFMNQLSDDPIFQGVLLRYAKETLIIQGNPNRGKPVRLIQFQIECKILA